MLLGNNALESRHISVAAGRSRAFRFRAIARGPVAEAHVYVDSGSNANSLTVGLYSNGRGRPGTLLSTGSINLMVVGAWNSVRLRPVTLRSGGIYWLAVLGEGGVLSYRDRRRGHCLSQASLQANLASLPRSWSRARSNQGCRVSAYVTRVAKSLRAEEFTPSKPLVLAEVFPPSTSPLVLAPSNTLPPTISGTPLTGEMLTASQGEWTESPTSYSYQWQTCEASGELCSDVEGATAKTKTYTLGSGDVGYRMRVLVTATNAIGVQSASSSLTAAVDEPPPAAPTNTVRPMVSGETVEGEVLEASKGEWTGSPTSYAYQWQRCGKTGSGCSNVSGATADTYMLGSRDVEHTLRVVVKATNAGGTGSADSALSGVVEEPAVPPPTAPKNASLPMISGEAIEGKVLSAGAGSWTGSPTSYAYQWQRCGKTGSGCSNVSGATADTYMLGSRDVEHTLRVVVKATNAGGTGSADSALSGVVEEPAVPPPTAPKNASLPMISGEAIEGKVLSAGAGSWTGSPTSYAYQWQRCGATGGSCVNVTGATRNGYSLGSGDLNHEMRVVVSATNAGGTTSATSPASAAVTAPPPPTNTSLPAITGTAIEGQSLSASTGMWSSSPTSYAYQWQRCTSSCANVSGATAETYSLDASDVGSAMRVIVSATNSAGTALATSAQTATVMAHTGAQAGCFAAPGACGYPDPNYANVGPSVACSSLASSGELTVTTAGATIENKNITGGVTVAAKNVTLTNDCINLNGNGSGTSSIVVIAKGETGTQITHSSISGANNTTQSVEEAINNNYANAETVADHDYIYNCGECVHGTWTLTNSYVTSNANISGAHYEDIYCSDATSLIEHNVLINPHEQTANIFCNTGGGDGGAADNHLTITNNLFAGAGYSLYPQGNAASIGTSTMKVVGNRFARCLTTPVTDSEGDVTCSGGADENGYWPRGGYYGIDAYTYCPPAAGQEWSNNVWDDNEEPVGC